jgi:hypothetical protein
MLGDDVGESNSFDRVKYKNRVLLSIELLFPIKKWIISSLCEKLYFLGILENRLFLGYISNL